MDAGEPLVLAGGKRRTRRPCWLPWAVVVGVILLGLGSVWTLSSPNTITPAGIILHHSALTIASNASLLDVRLLDEVHRQRGYGIFYWGRVYHVGYHYILLPDGTVQRGRPERCRGAHARGYNDSFGVCLIGDFSTKDNPTGERGLQKPTPAQMRALVTLCRRLRARYHIPLQNVRRHRDVDPATECPGDRFPFLELLKQLDASPSAP